VGAGEKLAVPSYRAESRTYAVYPFSASFRIYLFSIFFDAS